MDTLSNEKGLKWEFQKNTPLIIAFAGMAENLNELNHFEFVKSTRHANCSKIYCLDAGYFWYQHGLTTPEVGSISKLVDKLKALICEAAPTHIRCIGVSAGGFAAILFGYLLKVDIVHAFGPQIFLTRELEERYRPQIQGCDGGKYDTGEKLRIRLDSLEGVPGHVLDLEPVLRAGNGKTKFILHVGKDHKRDMVHANHIKECLGVEIKPYNCAGHACASQMLVQSGQLSKVILEGI